MKLNKIAIAVGAAAMGLSGIASAELSANIGATSNYLWRGVTQTDNGAAISGGIDYTNASGFYAGVWASNVDFVDEPEFNDPTDPTDDEYENNGQAELDLYLGFAGEAGSVGYDIGLIYYAYPLAEDFGGDEDELDFTEIYGSLSFGPVSGGVHYTVDTEAGGDDSNWYYYLGASFDVAPTWSVGGTVGSYDFDDGFDYKHAQLDLSKDAGDFGTFTLTVSKVFDNDEDDDGEDVYDDDALVFVSWGKSF